MELMSLSTEYGVPMGISVNKIEPLTATEIPSVDDSNLVND